MNCPGVRSNALASLKTVLIWTSRCPFSIRDISVGCTPLRLADLLLGQSVVFAGRDEVPGELGDGVHAGDHLVRCPNFP